MVEFDSDDKQNCKNLSSEIVKNLKLKKYSDKVYQPSDDAEKERFWAVRKAAALIFYKLKGRSKATHIFESAAISTSRLVGYFRNICSIMEKYNTKFVMLGHVAKGVVHTEPLLNLEEKKGYKIIKRYV